MLKIKLKKIPFKTQARICAENCCNSDCPFYAGNTAMLIGNYLEHITCIRDARCNPEKRYIELSEKDFPTNREWMESLSNEELAVLLTTGLFIHGGKYDGLKATISLITDKEDLLDWLSQPCVYLMEE